MIEYLFTELTIAMGGNFFLALSAALGWGVLSILLSPCHLSSIPLVIGYISRRGETKTIRSFYLSLVFALGILITIAVIGLITAAMGRLMGDVGRWGNYLVAVILILIGLYLMDLIRWDWGGIVPIKNNHNGIAGAFLLGLLFGIGLGPCTFAFLAPVLAVVFQTATENGLKAALLITAFAMGHCLVIIAAGTLTGKVQAYLDWSENNKSTMWVKKICGLLVILAGIYLFTFY
ncbi:MAG: cytochrome C biogenesis protein [Calditrichales bacterium]|nr:MAG: cytochrome C biogenesis protein [Calditrichales bacterium]